MQIVWVVFSLLVYFNLHLSVYDIKDFHGAFMGESYLVASGISQIVFGLTILIILFAIVNLIKNREKIAQLLALILAGFWIVFYTYVCSKTAYFF